MMALKTFSVLEDETRLIKYMGCLYKVKLSYRNIPRDISLEKLKITSDLQTELEEVLRAVLFNVINESEMPVIQTQNFYISPMLKSWKAQQELGFVQNGRELEAYENVIVLVFTPHQDGELWRLIPKDLAKERQKTLARQSQGIGNTLTTSHNEKNPNAHAALEGKNRVGATDQLQAGIGSTSAEADRSINSWNRSQVNRRSTRAAMHHSSGIDYNLRHHTPRMAILQNTKLQKGKLNNSNSNEDQARSAQGHRVVREKPKLNFLDIGCTKRRDCERRKTVTSKSAQRQQKKVKTSQVEYANSQRVNTCCRCNIRVESLLASEDHRLEDLTKMTHASAHFYQKDRYLVEESEIKEELKLQQLARMEGDETGVSKLRGRKRHSLLQMVTDNIVTPVKRIFQPLY